MVGEILNGVYWNTLNDLGSKEQTALVVFAININSIKNTKRKSGMDMAAWICSDW